MPSSADSAARPTRPARSAKVVHHVPGRLRIRVAGVQGKEEFFANVKDIISGLHGVTSVRVNPVTSSIVIDYSPVNIAAHLQILNDPQVSRWLQVDSDDIFEKEIGELFTTGGRFLKRHSHLAEFIVSSAEQVDAKFGIATSGYLDLKVLLPLGVAAATSIHRSRGKGTPMWLTLSIFAFNTFVALHRNRIDIPFVEVTSTSKKHV